MSVPSGTAATWVYSITTSKMKANIYIETFGCQMNVADTERTTSRLRDAGFDLTEEIDLADVVIFNTCSVRAKAEQKAFTRIGEVGRNSKGKKPVIGVMGCVAQLEGESIFAQAPDVNMVVGTRAYDRLPSIIDDALSGRRRSLDLSGRDESDSWSVSPVERRSRHVAFVPIIEGCNKFCAYCIVPFSRGREISRPASEIIGQICELKQEGYREVHLIGQNVNSYRPKTESGLEGVEGATLFSRLLRTVAKTGFERIKFTTSFPKDFHPCIVKAMDEHENLCDWVHLPVQSGNDRVLRNMRRGYRVADYISRVEAIKSARRRLALTSDIIVGFPGETVEEFEDTMKLVEYCQYDSLYIFKYSERPNTPAANLKDDVSEREKAARFLALERLQKGIQKNIYNSYIGRIVSVLIEGESQRSEEDVTGHTTCNKVVNFKGDHQLIGKIVPVRITQTKTNSLYGQLVS